MRLLWGHDDIESINKRYWFLDTPYEAAAWNVSHRSPNIPGGNFANRTIEFLFVERDLLENAEAHRRMSNIAIGAALYRQVNGVWPKSLGELAPKYLSSIASDPRSGRAFAFKSVGDGFVLLLPDQAEEIERHTEHLLDQRDENWLREACQLRFGSSPTLFIGDAFRRANASP